MGTPALCMLLGTSLDLASGVVLLFIRSLDDPSFGANIEVTDSRRGLSLSDVVRGGERVDAGLILAPPAMRGREDILRCGVDLPSDCMMK